jgi:hypothetical protein
LAGGTEENKEIREITSAAPLYEQSHMHLTV